MTCLMVGRPAERDERSEAREGAEAGLENDMFNPE
jgi:hypothetical protein